MKMKKLIMAGMISAVLGFHTQNALAWCPPGYTVQSEPGYSGSPTCLVSIDGSFGQEETKSEVHYLEEGKNYLFSASGCPRVGTIGIYLLDDTGRIVMEEAGYRPSFSYKADRSGDYTVQVKVLSLVGDNTWGNVDACFSEE